MAGRDARVILDTYATAGPDAMIRAAADLSLEGGLHVQLVGHAATVRERLAAISYDPMRLHVVDCPVPYARRTGDELAALEAARQALPVSLEMLVNGDADAMVTASAASLVLELVGKHVPAIAAGLPLAEAAVFPTMPRRNSDDPLALLVDVSGRRAAGPESLVAFALMGAAYSRVVTGVREPHVGLLSTGLTADRGPDDVVAAHALLRHTAGFHFTGNVRATDLPRGFADVVVTDGFTGHAVVGLLGALADLTVDAARYAWKSKVSWRVAMRILRKGVGMLKRVSEFKEYGGAPVLGLRHPVIIADPDSSPAALSNALKLAAKCHRRGLVAEIERTVAMSDAWRVAKP